VKKLLVAALVAASSAASAASATPPAQNVFSYCNTLADFAAVVVSDRDKGYSLQAIVATIDLAENVAEYRKPDLRTVAILSYTSTGATSEQVAFGVYASCEELYSGSRL
jgi:hypothetical protein